MKQLARLFRMAFVVAVLLPSFAVQAESSSKQAASELAQMLESYESYQARFIQIVVNENGSRVQESRGFLKAKRPGLFYWETREPYSQFIVSDGSTVEVYDPDLEQVTVHSLDERVQTTPALLLSGEVGNLDETYRVSGRSKGEHTHEFTLEPRSADSLFVSLRLTFYKGELQEMRMEDSLSQISVLSFDEIELNKAIEDTAFTLDYPDEVDVIRDGA
ncbi:outer membrane lipoprotein chaperone LolA [Marinobacter sp. NP-4(2019)]|uniref:outer membrane lipoprotein chaperone LolA n=1 Tax=Marinobacter sp. NP-4(2019) TaxID=2488665 RepID=UPI000FC3D36C|nr:outer membrane lipoprotein chaperone LolA [Marinobacter sp. NP-4(2019)]